MQATATTTTTQQGVSDHEYDLMLTAAFTTARQLESAFGFNTFAEELATLRQQYETTSTRATDYSKCAQSGAHWAL